VRLRPHPLFLSGLVLITFNRDQNQIGLRLLKASDAEWLPHLSHPAGRKRFPKMPVHTRVSATSDQLVSDGVQHSGGLIMAIRRWAILGVLWLISLVAVSAQAPLWQRLPEPRVFFGEDVGFRVEGLRGEVPTGVIVIKINGKWVEAQVGPKLGPIR
jgi:hypothetical protein